MRSILPSRIRRSESAWNNANLMLEEPLLTARMLAFVSVIISKKFQEQSI